MSSDSPSRICIILLGIGTRWAMADTAIGSVGESTAASANATGSGMAGINQWMKTPMPRTVKTTRPSASWITVPLSLKSSSGGMRQPSRNSSGGKKSRKKTCGSSVTTSGLARPMSAPSATWISGRGMENGNSRCNNRAMKSLSTTASNRIRMTATVSNGLAFRLTSSAFTQMFDNRCAADK